MPKKKRLKKGIPYFSKKDRKTYVISEFLFTWKGTPESAMTTCGNSFVLGGEFEDSLVEVSPLLNALHKKDS